jgi:hypothetical protein
MVRAHPASRPLQAALAPAAAVLALALADEARADGQAFPEVLGITPERVAAFREALRDSFTPAEGERLDAQLDLELVSLYDAPPRGTSALLLPEPPTPWGRDLVHDESFLIAGREEDHEEAARDWLARELKGSTRASMGRSPRVSPRLAWNDGPLFGVRHRGLSARVGPGQWRLKVTRRMPGAWRASFYVGERDDETRVGFVIGRSLLRSIE